MSKTDKSGQAFPQTTTESWGGETSVEVSGGLTKREIFAMAAMQGILSADTDCEFNASSVATSAVEQADALITALKED